MNNCFDCKHFVNREFHSNLCLNIHAIMDNEPMHAGVTGCKFFKPSYQKHLQIDFEARAECRRLWRRRFIIGYLVLSFINLSILTLIFWWIL